MSYDIRRMNFEEIENLNAQAKAWRERNDPAKGNPCSSSLSQYHLSVSVQAGAAPGEILLDTMATIQLDLFGEPQ